MKTETMIDGIRHITIESTTDSDCIFCGCQYRVIRKTYKQRAGHIFDNQNLSHCMECGE